VQEEELLRRLTALRSAQPETGQWIGLESASRRVLQGRGDRATVIPFSCYKLRSPSPAEDVADFDQFVNLDSENNEIRQFGPVRGADFEAKLYTVLTPPHEPGWASFLADGFTDPPAAVEFPRSASSGALLVLRLEGDDAPYFAFAFGFMGRHLLRDTAAERAYGLRTALNLIYPRGGSADPGKVVSVDATRRSAGVLRSRLQANRATTFETFEVDHFRDVLTAATGRPSDVTGWGTRVSGGDALNFSADVDFAGLGAVCRKVENVHRRTDYRERFSWLDHIQPVTNPERLAALQVEVVNRLRNRDDLEVFDLAPPEILDWTRVDAFRYHFEARQRQKRPDLRAIDFVTGVAAVDNLDELSVEYLQKKRITALDGGGGIAGQWSVWRCLSCELRLGDDTFILDEGAFFQVERNYLRNLNQQIDEVVTAAVALPAAAPGMREADYNQLAVNTLAPHAVLLDRQIIRSSAITTGVEVCDLLTSRGQLIHVKRHLGSSDLSHLFSQGYVSADLLQNDVEFRTLAHDKITSLTGDAAFQMFDHALEAGRFEIVYGVIADWNQRSLASALPFFSKVTLRKTAQDLANRGFGVSFAKIVIE
jgi:uncharacterized protein (TIGR04141 family)